jgi:hypothetical protein
MSKVGGQEWMRMVRCCKDQKKNSLDDSLMMIRKYSCGNESRAAFFCHSNKISVNQSRNQFLNFELIALSVIK